MMTAPFRHIGGAILTDHGPLTLREARRLAEVYRRETAHWADAGHAAGQAMCRSRAQALEEAVSGAETWRRAAGWAFPDDADG